MAVNLHEFHVCCKPVDCVMECLSVKTLIWNAGMLTGIRDAVLAGEIDEVSLSPSLTTAVPKAQFMNCLLASENFQ